MTSAVVISLCFLLANLVILWIVLRLNLKGGRAVKVPDIQPGERRLAAADVLGWEFEYARITASESMEQRHTLVNFYLLIAAIITSGVVAFLGGQATELRGAATILLWLLCGIGWLHFLAVIRLRQAWRDSALAMNWIKEFCIQHASEFEPAELRKAFLWKPSTLPVAGKPWTVFFYSAMQIAVISSVAFVAGGVLLDLSAVRASPLPTLGPLLLAGLGFFAFQVWLYFAFLREKEVGADQTRQGASHQNPV